MEGAHRINILFTNASYYSLERGIGGGEVHLLSLISQLSEDKYNIFVAYPGAGPFEELLENKPVTPLRIRSLRGKHEPFSFMRIMSLIRKYRINVVHAYEPKSAFWAMIGANLLKVPGKIYTVHLPCFTPYWKETGLRWARDKIRFLRDTFTSHMADRIIAVSEEIRTEKIERQHIPPEKVVTILNGVDTDIFSSKSDDCNYTRARFNIPNGVPTIGVVARLEPHKGHGYLIQAMPAVIDAVPETRLLVIGEGWCEQEVRKAVSNKGLERHIIFTGFQGDMPSVLSGLDIVVLPSLYESTNLSLIEAMLMEKPVVASAIPSHMQMIQDGVNGLLVRPADIESLAKAMIKLLKDRRLARVMAGKAREVALQRFTLDRMCQETEAIYENLLSKTGR